MSPWRIEFHQGSVLLPQLGLWLDAHDPQPGPERVFVSHAHSDHIGEHREVILSAPTAKLMETRLPGVRIQHILDYDRPKNFNHADAHYRVTLLPAGHIFGSAMSLIEADAKSLLYTGDFKLRHGLSAEPCQPRHADTLIMETTYGRPQYVFPPAAAVLDGVVRFCRETLDNDATPVLLGYSLGKSQELLCGLGDAGFPLMLHGTIFKLTQIYEQFGQCFPKYERYLAGAAKGKVLLCPPSVVNSAMLRNLGDIRTAILTGWAVDPNCRYRYRCDAAFPLSDHADFPDLIEMVKQVQPKQVFTLHGFAADFARTLRELGFNAQALSQQEQFELAIKTDPISKSTPVKPVAAEVSGALSEAHENAASPSALSPKPGHSFEKFALTCKRISEDTRKLEKVRFLGEYLHALDRNALPLAATWFTGRPFPGSQNKVLQLGWAALRDALTAVGAVKESELHQVYLKHSDVGETAGELLADREVRPTLSVEEVDELFQKLHSARGPLAKTPLLIDALRRCTAIEAKYLVKIITGDLRIGLKEGLVEEGIAAAFGRAAEEVRQANLLLGDIGQTALLAMENRLNESTLVPFRPLKFMLASPEETAKAIWDRMHAHEGLVPGADAGQASTAPPPPPQTANPLWIEDKYDGIRCQLHKVGPRVALYSRDLKDITTSFLELADAARSVPHDFILDGEIVPMRGDAILPFADLQKRLGRREGDLFMREEVPIKYVAFDLLWMGGRDFLRRPLRERRQALESLAPLPDSFRFARITQAGSAEEIESAFDAARALNNEGLLIKDPASPYTPGRRGLAWLKLKRALATLDCVVVGAEYGHGKCRNVLSDYTFAVRDESTNQLKTIGKAYSGLTDAEIAQLTSHFLQTAIRQQGRYFEVEPDTVLEIAFDKIQASDRHDSGLAMRFPRIARIRTDKSVAEIDTLATARKMALR